MVRDHVSDGGGAGCRLCPRAESRYRIEHRLQVGGDVSAPLVIHSVEPEYKDAARNGKVSGNVLVSLIVDAHGNPSHVHVVQGLHMGLDERALEAVRQYKFKPGMRDGKPVRVELTIVVNFHEPAN